MRKWIICAALLIFVTSRAEGAISFDAASNLHDMVFYDASAGTYANRSIITGDYFDDNSAVGDYIAFGTYNGQWHNLSVNVGTQLVADSITLVWEYMTATATWVAITGGVTDNTNSFQTAGVNTVDFAVPDSWYHKANLGAIATADGCFIRARITEVTNISEGGANITNTVAGDNWTIIISGGENVTPASLKALDVANGWGVITFENNVYIFACRLYFATNGASTFTSDNVDVQIGTATRLQVSGFTGGNTYIFNPKGATYLSSQYVNFLKIYDYSLTFGINGTASSECNNMMISPMTYRMAIQSAGSFYNCNIGLTYTTGAGQYERCNFNHIQYLLTSPTASYKNCYFRTYFSVDPGYLPVIVDSVFDAPDDTIFLNRYNPDVVTRHHYFEALDCTWANNNKFIFDKGNGELSENIRHVYNHLFNLTIVDEAGDGISGAAVALTDQYGNSQLYTNIGGYAAANYDMDDTTITVNDGTLFTVDKYYKLYEEVMKVTDINANVLTVDRAQNGTTPFDANASTLAILYEQEDSVATDADGVIPEHKVIEYAFFRFGDGVTSAKTEYTYSPYTLTVSKSGFRTYTGVITIDKKTDWDIILDLGDSIFYDSTLIDCQIY